MSYIFLPELAGGSSAGNCSDTDASVLLKLTLTPKPSSLPDKTTAHSRLSRFLMTYKTLMADHGEELLTSWPAGSLARMSALPEKAQDLTVSVADCGATLPASLAKYDPVTHSLKTAQCSLIEDLTGCCVTLPRSGLMRNGVCYQRQIVEPRTSEIESGFWPTPTTQDNIQIKGVGKAESNPKRGTTLAGSVAMSLTSTHSVSLDAQTAKAMVYPTATATMHKGWSPNHNRANTDDRLDYTIERQAFQPGQQTPPMRLNPDWVEWLIGWPIGHTDLKPLETGRFQEFVQQHSIY